MNGVYCGRVIRCAQRAHVGRAQRSQAGRDIESRRASQRLAAPQQTAAQPREALGKTIRKRGLPVPGRSCARIHSWPTQQPAKQLRSSARGIQRKLSRRTLSAPGSPHRVQQRNPRRVPLRLHPSAAAGCARQRVFPADVDEQAHVPARQQCTRAMKRHRVRKGFCLRAEAAKIR